MKKRIISLILIICLLMPSVGFAREDYTSLLLEKGIISGDEKGLRMEDNVLRCEFVKMVNRTFKISLKGNEPTFNDVNKNEWFYSDFAAAVEKGYLKGDEKGNLNPYDLITRQEAVTMIGRLTGFYNNGETLFKDNDKIQSWAKGSVLALSENGIITGNGDNTFNPSGKLTRFESFVILTRILSAENDAVIEINSPFELYLTEIYPEKDFILSDNLDLSGKALPLPLCKNGFFGTFDGKGFKITGLTTEYNDYALFDTVEENAKIKNLTLVCPEYFASVTKTNNGTIENCGHNSFTENKKQYQSGDFFGAFAWTNNGTIRSCYTSSFLKIRNDGYIGGICGVNNGTISTCFTTSDGDANAFGIAVINNSVIEKSFTTGSLIACKGGTGSVKYVSFINGESSIGTKTDIDSLRTIYGFSPFVKDRNYAFPVLKDVPYSKGDNFGEFGGGSGTKDDPFLISSPLHLINAANYPEAYFLQKNDIDMSHSYDFMPIGDEERPFSGVYDGNGYLIKNLTIIRPSIKEPALFGTNTGKITNLHLKDCYIEGTDAAASVVYRNYGICSFITSDSLINAPNTGGIVCFAEGSSVVEKCTFMGTVNASNGAGIIFSNKGRVENCAFIGTINASNGVGICYLNQSTLDKILCAGSVFASRADDICMSNSGTAENCYYTNTSRIENAVMRQKLQLSFKESFTGLDFEQIWRIYSMPLPKGTDKYISEHLENTTEFAGGDGSIINPYKIATPLNFVNINRYPYACFILMNDLDFSIVGPDTPVENFKGKLDGNGRTITGINAESAVININNGAVKNLNAQSNICKTNNAIISDCHVMASLSGENTGGICTTNNGLVERSSFTGNIFANLKGGGISSSNTGIIENCSVNGNVTGKNESSVIFGISENNGGEISLCLVTADLYFTDAHGTFYPISSSYVNSNYLDRYNEKYQGKLNFSEIVEKSSFDGFDFKNVWSFNSLNFPVLKGQENTPQSMVIPFRSGNGSKENPYTVSNATDLYNIRLYPQSYFVLVNDINLLGENSKISLLNNSGKGFTPLPDFYGSIDGNGHSILGLEILYSDKENAGLTQNLYGTVKNINFIDCRIEGDNNTGIVCGVNYGQIDNINVVGSRIGAKNSNCGSITGVNKGTITNCTNNSDIFASVNTGGIAGVNDNTIISCASHGGIITNSSDSNSYSGGISGTNNGVIETSLNTGKVLAYSDLTSAQAGGIAGKNNSHIINCYNTGQISSKGAIESLSGGICASAEEKSYITAVYNTGYCTSSSPSALTGALIGSAKGRILNAYYDHTLAEAFGENNLQKNDSLALSPEEMTNISSFKKFNTSTVWTMAEGYSYPQLVDNPHIIYPLKENIRDFAGGDGSIENPYLIFTPEQLDNVRKYLGGTYMLIGDLDMSQYCILNGFEPIGDNIFSFFGTFIGNDSKITGITQNGNYYGGLFSRNNGEIYNLITCDFDINAQISGNLAAVNTGLVYECSNISDISAKGETVFAGGLVGLNKSSGMIIYSSNASDISSSGDSSQSGGICYGNYGIIAGCFNSGNYVFSEGSKLSMSGGISSFNYGTISDCYSNADIYSNDISGGICATNTGNLINCYTTASSVFGKTYGGICANAQNSLIANCYYPIDRIDHGVAVGEQTGAVGVESQTMLIEDTFIGFDFENMWIMIDGYCPLISETAIE